MRAWQQHANQDRKQSDLVGEFYELCDVLKVSAWDPDDAMTVSRLGTLARFTMLLTDYESVRRRARPDANAPGEQVGGQDRGPWHYKNLAVHIINYAQGAYEGFDGEPDVDLDAVDLTTVHRAKGLEWPVVFVPAMTANRFPSSKTGTVQDWQLPRDMFNAARYEGSDADERRLFYVAITRARDFVSVSRHDRVTTKRVRSSPYFDEVDGHRCQPESGAVPGGGAEAGRRGTARDTHVQRAVAVPVVRHGVPAARTARLPAAPRSRTRLRQGRAPHAPRSRGSHSGDRQGAVSSGRSTGCSTTGSSSRPPTRSPTGR